MTYFSRLTDIVTCNLSALLDSIADPQDALVRIIAEIEEGLAGAERSMRTAAKNAARLRSEIDEQSQEAARWTNRARQELADGHEDKARQALIRKREIEDLMAGLQQQHSAAEATEAHLTTTLRALEARLADARRRQQQLMDANTSSSDSPSEVSRGQAPAKLGTQRDREIDVELAALRRELEG